MLILGKTSINNKQIGQLLWYKEYITLVHRAIYTNISLLAIFFNNDSLLTHLVLEMLTHLKIAYKVTLEHSHFPLPSP